MLGVRVICVMENYDSGEAIESEIISLENIMNTYYVKDIQKKVDASITNRPGARQGCYEGYAIRLCLRWCERRLEDGSGGGEDGTSDL